MARNNKSWLQGLDSEGRIKPSPCSPCVHYRVAYHDGEMMRYCIHERPEFPHGCGRFEREPGADDES